MRTSRVFFVGTPAEVEHHAQPVAEALKVEIICPHRIVRQAKPGDVAIFFSEHFDRFRQAIIELKQKNVATIYMIDGILEWRNAWENRPDEVACPFAMRPVLSHKAACIGENQARILNGWANAAKTEIVGIPRFDRYRGSIEPSDSSEHPRSDRDRFRLLVMTAKTPAFTTDQWSAVRRAVADCKSFADRHADSVEVLWRLTGGLDSTIGVENSTNDRLGVELCDALDNVDAVISTPSTAIVESMLMGKPTALLNYFDCPSYINLAWTIVHDSQIQRVVSQLQRPDTKKMHFQNQQLQSLLYRESPAKNRMIELVVKMQEEAESQIADQKMLSFEPNLLSMPKLSPVAFKAEAIFPESNEFAETDLEEIQSQLAHSRRHIDHLNRQIEQLKTELGQAHRIFDEIHQHPIAGPIVRIRERLLATLKTVKRKSHPDKSH